MFLRSLVSVCVFVQSVEMTFCLKPSQVKPAVIRNSEEEEENERKKEKKGREVDFTVTYTIK